MQLCVIFLLFLIFKKKVFWFIIFRKTQSEDYIENRTFFQNEQRLIKSARVVHHIKLLKAESKDEPRMLNSMHFNQGLICSNIPR